METVLYSLTISLEYATESSFFSHQKNSTRIGRGKLFETYPLAMVQLFHGEKQSDNWRVITVISPKFFQKKIL